VYHFTLEQFTQPLEAERRRNGTGRFPRDVDGINMERSCPQDGAVSGVGRRSTFLPKDEALLVELKEDKRLSWEEIADHFPGKKKGTLQVRYCTKLKRRSETPKKTKNGRGLGEPHVC
jgi:hypothetical protein